MSRIPAVSFEFFPPQTLDASFRLWETVQTLAPLNPSFMSVTYGAGAAPAAGIRRARSSSVTPRTNAPTRRQSSRAGKR